MRHLIELFYGAASQAAAHLDLVCQLNLWLFFAQLHTPSTKYQFGKLNRKSLSNVKLHSICNFQCFFSEYFKTIPETVCPGFSCSHRIMGDKQSCGQGTIMSVRGHGFRYFVAFTPTRNRRPFQRGPR